MGRKKKVVETKVINPEEVVKEVIESEKPKAIEEPIKSERSNMVKVRMLADISCGAEYTAGQVVTIHENVYNQISQSCVKV